MARASQPKGRRTTTRKGTTDPAGAVVPEPRIRGMASSGGTVSEAGDSPPPAEVVHLIPAESLEEVDTMGMSMPIGVGDSVAAVRLPGDTVLTRPDESSIPTDDELDDRDAAKGTRRKRTGPRRPSGARPDLGAATHSAPPPNDPG